MNVEHETTPLRPFLTFESEIRRKEMPFLLALLTSTFWMENKEEDGVIKIPSFPLELASKPPTKRRKYDHFSRVIHSALVKERHIESLAKRTWLCVS